jgi:trimeric autotransporter adhesin
MMKKPPLFFLLIALFFSVSSYSQNILAGRQKEMFKKTNLATGLLDPWEITFGPDNFLWITEAKGYKVYRMDTATGARTTILDISETGTGYLTPAEHTTYNRGPWPADGTRPFPQGGLMGLAIHPDFNAPIPKKYVYIAYVHDAGVLNTNGNGQFYTNYLVRFTYDVPTNELHSPITLCDSLPGSKDHNSGRLIIARETTGGPYYLYYAEGDMGGGQFENVNRPIKSQLTNSYEGKILRFNLEPDADVTPALNRWIPSGASPNPFNAVLGVQSAVWAKGMRNNQGFGFDSTKNILYCSSHGPFSDDELNLLEAGKNYGHPIVIGMNDGNYDGAKAGPSAGAAPLITTEAASVTSIGVTNYRDPLMSFYDVPRGNITTPSSVQFIYQNANYTAPYNPTGAAQNRNMHWESEALSGMDFYSNSLIPGWKNSLLVCGLKWGRLLRLKLDNLGTAIVPIGSQDTVTYFESNNRYRDIAFSPDGRDIFIAMDNSSATSGPSQDNPAIIGCTGCIQKWTFLGYDDISGSTIPTNIPIARGTPNACKTVSPVRINSFVGNNTFWVPITDDSSNVVAEIKANGNNLNLVTSSFYYKNSGSVREDNNKKLYFDRNITITPANQPTSNVDIRIYVTQGELNRMISATNSLGQPSSVATINDLSIFKNNNSCGAAITSGATKLTTARAAFGSGYVLSASIPSFSTFYLAANALTTLPVDLISFTGSLGVSGTNLSWSSAGEINLANYVVERSLNGRNFEAIGTVSATGIGGNAVSYAYTDIKALTQPAPVIYYRLKIVDADNSYAYSNVVTVNLTTIAGKVFAMPNITANITKVTMTVATEGNAQWQILDNNGRVVLQKSIHLKKGYNATTINISNLAAGLYYLNVSGAGIDQKIKLEKL